MFNVWRRFNFWALLVFVPINLYLVLIYAPIEGTMGVIQKLFYVHVAAAWIGLVAFGVVFIFSIVYLITRRSWTNQIALASAEIGAVFITCVLLTGPLWAKPIWNTWWTWDPKLTTTLVLWFMYIAYILLQSGGSSESRRKLAAVYQIVAFVNVPLVFFSTRWWRSIHPVIVTATDFGLTAQMKLVLFVTLSTFSLIYTYLLVVRYRGICLMDQINRVKEVVR